MPNARVSSFPCNWQCTTRRPDAAAREVYGERVGFPIEDSLAVFDFNIGAARSQFDSPNSSFVREPSIVGHGLFVELAMTWLPCRLSKREMDGDRESTFIIDQERVLEVEVRYSFWRPYAVRTDNKQEDQLTIYKM